VTYSSVPGQYGGASDAALAAANPGERAEASDLTELFARRHAELVRLAVLLVDDQPTAEDIVQDVFARLHGRRSQGGGDGESLAYVRAAVLNGCRSQLRRRALARRLAGAHGKSFDQVTQDSAEQEVMRSEERRQVLDALATLSSRRREVLILRYYVGLSEAEIADVLGVSTGTVKSTAARGLAALARMLGGDA
jgi:RNA polymerase sigma-70 factor (sigma-E family)